MFKPTLTRVIDTATVEKIHMGTAQVLERCGVNFEEPTALKYFKDAGAIVDGSNVRIPLALFEKAMSQTPSSFTMTGIDSNKTFLVGEGQTRVHADPNFGCILIHEEGRGHREANMKDLADYHRLLHASEVCDIAGGIPVEPSDVPDLGRNLHLFREILRHTDKPFRSYIGTRKELYEMFDMVNMIKGDPHFLDNNTCMFASINPLSPMLYGSVPTQTLIAMAEKHQSICTLTCAISGFTSPMSMLGTAVMQNAEMLAGNVLLQIVNPGSPFLLGPASARPDMRTGIYANGSPEANLINIASLQVAREYYNIPCRTMAGLTDAKITDAQAGLETMQTLMTAMMGGAHQIHGCLASMDSLNITSFEKLVMSEEIFGRVLRYMEGIYERDYDFSVEEIIETGPTGTYMMNDATLANCYDTWRPTVSTQQPYAIWQEEGGKSLTDRAKERWQSILAECPDMIISKEQDDMLGEYLTKCGY